MVEFYGGVLWWSVTTTHTIALETTHQTPPTLKDSWDCLRKTHKCTTYVLFFFLFFLFFLLYFFIFLFFLLLFFIFLFFLLLLFFIFLFFLLLLFFLLFFFLLLFFFFFFLIFLFFFRIKKIFFFFLLLPLFFIIFLLPILSHFCSFPLYTSSHLTLSNPHSIPFFLLFFRSFFSFS